jgi:large repetitive protein
MRRVGALMAVCALAACGDGGQGSSAAPKLSYNGSTPFPAVVGEAIALTPAVSGRADHYTVTPALPSGLSLNARSGVISGTPTQPSTPAIFVVSATGAGVRVAFPLVLSVTEPPNGLSYASPVIATVGAALAPLRPSIAGSVDRYAVSPPLPPGLVLNGSSGILSGTPTEARSAAPYTITADSLAGSTHFVLVLTVTPSRSGAVAREGPTTATRF